MSSPDGTHHSVNELPVPQEPRRRVSISSDPPTLVDGHHSPYSGQETRRRLSVTSSDHQTSDGRRKSILVQHTPDNLSLHSQHSGNPHYTNYGYQHDGKFSRSRLLGCDAVSLGECSWRRVFRVRQASWTKQRCLTLKIKTLRSFGTTGSTNPVTQRHDPEDCSSQWPIRVTTSILDVPGRVGGIQGYVTV
jgi:hypothetical protein